MWEVGNEIDTSGELSSEMSIRLRLISNSEYYVIALRSYKGNNEMVRRPSHCRTNRAERLISLRPVSCSGQAHQERQLSVAGELVETLSHVPDLYQTCTEIGGTVG
jgi:hypothetical protein